MSGSRNRFNIAKWDSVLRQATFQNLLEPRTFPNKRYLYTSMCEL